MDAELQSLTADELDDLRRRAADESDRRHKLAQLPDDLAAMARDAAAAGCDPDELLERVTDALTTDQETAP